MRVRAAGRLERCSRARSATAGPVVVIALSMAVVGCADSESRVEGEADPSALPAEERTFAELSEFLDGYWHRPIPLQGDAPEGFSPLDLSLEPATCGTCHPQQFADWRTTVHADAYSPGLSGQLVNWESYNYQSVRDCLVCHAPLSEQSAQVPDTADKLVPNPFFDSELQSHGLVCAACHVRGWRRYGPPRRDDGSLALSPAGSPHGGVKRTEYFEDSRFCSGCHQFEFPAPKGKSLQNTYNEWRNSRYAEQGVICQSCHMPDRRHLWRGIHDSTMVASGVTIEWIEPGERAGPGGPVSLRLTNTGTGHRFPTYVTPEVRVRVQLLDSDSTAIEGAFVEQLIRRRVEARGGTWVEVSDTRLQPDSGLTITLTDIGPSARFARGKVVVYPDAFYHRVFSGMLTAELSDTSRVLITEALRRAGESPFAIFDETIPISNRGLAR